MKKLCQVCKTEIPSDFVNLLCVEHYKKQEKENEQRLADEVEDRKKMGLESSNEPYPAKDDKPLKPSEKPAESPIELSDGGISDPNYKENPEMDDKPQWEANIVQFAKTEILLWKPTKSMYTYVKDYMLSKVMEHPQYPKFIWKPKVVDVGSGIGVGANILSQEADFVWGIDKNEASVKFAQQAFSRIKNNIYYSSQVTFDHLDILKDTREFLKFDVVVAIEIIEHISNHQLLLETIIKKFDKGKEGYEATEYFISTPNRNNRHIRKDHPHNLYHVKEFTSQEFIAVLSKYFKNIELMNAEGVPVGDKTDHTPIIACCSGVKI
ncbi:MAG TPA: class I SAM-dependent methyltransferase [bacterium]|nr:class I SAM-dependent methyltransferase [bacterium]